MKILLDEDVPHPSARQLLGHDIRTDAGLGRGGVKNGKLLKLLAVEGFKVFVTGDKNMQNQQTIQNRPFAIVLLSTIHWPVLRKHVPAIAQAIESATLGIVTPADCGSFSAKRRLGNWPS